ncbi:MAG TPA: tol-pal system protein YbgF [Candidatus Polarisedimenticolaceae bacterium]|nr:tol-pal system protein YbgF [Candidatus Polarisedimenticolaceae bacterium]
MEAKTIWGALGLVAVTAASSGCVMPDKVAGVQKNLADIQADIRQIQQSQDETRARLETLEQRTANDEDRVTKADFADVTVSIDQLSRDVAIVDERVNDISRRFDRMSQQVQQARESRSIPYPGGEPSDAGMEPVIVDDGSARLPSTGAGAVPDPDALYNTAYADFSKGNYALAVSGFEEYHEKFPASALADNALYWVGECHYSQGNFPDAIRAFDQMLETYPQSDKAAASNLKKGLAYLEQNEVGQAIVQLRYVVAEYPGSDEAKIARDKLTSLGAPS